MSEALLVVAVLAAALTCPAMMWIQSRRGKSAPCCPPRHDEAAPESLDQLRARHERVTAELAELEAVPGDAPRQADGVQPVGR